MELVEKATQYMRDNASKVDPAYRSLYHIEPTVGWMNDPNGLIFLDGEFHLFYQANPYAAKNENMAWGHFITKDFIHYEETDFALYPNGKDESGCFSGSAFVEDGKMKLVYTRHLDLENGIKETQYLCNTEDKIHFEVEDQPCVDVNELPENISRSDFRDPQIFFKNGVCYLIIGGHDDKERGVFIVYSGKNSGDLHYSFYFGPYENTKMMVECPAFIQVDGKDVIIYSSYGVERKNGQMNFTHESYYIMGKFLGEEKAFHVEAEGLLDCGDAFYAPRTIENYETPTMIGWMENWYPAYRTAVFGHNWVGSFSFPRVMKIRDGKLAQELHPNLLPLLGRHKKISQKGNIKFHSFNEFSFKGDFLLTLRGQNGRLKIYSKDRRIYLDALRSNNLHENVFRSTGKYSSGKISFLLDTSSIELFINDGEETISTRYYLHGLSFAVTEKRCMDFVSRKIEVK